MRPGLTPSSARGFALVLALCAGLAASLSCSRLTAPDAQSAGDGEVEGGGNGEGPFVGGVGVAHTLAGVVSVVPAADRLLVEWRVSELDESSVELALFVSDDPDTVYEADPIAVPTASGRQLVEGLATGTRWYVGLGLRELAEGGLPWIPAGPVIDARTATPIYANPLAEAVGADGLTPETAFPNLFIAILTAFVQGAGQGGNVWVSEGTFEGASMQVLRGVDLYGGFGADFDLAANDPSTRVTRLEGLAGAAMLIFEAGEGRQLVDGLELDGLDGATFGLDVDNTGVELRRSTVRACSRGLRARSSLVDVVVELALTGCTITDNQVEGVSIDGAFDVRLEASSFERNGQEGVEFGPWIAPAGETVRTLVRDCAFLGNGAEGLDLDLVAPVGAGALGGLFDLVIEDCDFEQNALMGLLVDLDYEATPAWDADIVVRGSSARANGSHGFAFDIDAESTCLLHRVRSTSNGGDGLSITSETRRGFATVSTSVFAANLGYGARTSLGNVGAAFAHCLVLGNGLGGLHAQSIAGTAISTLSHLQSDAFDGVFTRGSVEAEPSPLPFLYAPVEYRRVSGPNAGEWTLEAPFEGGVGAICELASDSTLRTVLAVGVNGVVLDPDPITPPLPTSLCRFPGTDSVEEDYRLSPTSPGLGAGATPPGAVAIDAGLFGWPLGAAAGADELDPPTLFRVANTTPAWGESIDPRQDFVIEFTGGEPDGTSLATATRLLNAQGGELPHSVQLENGRLILAPPSGGWSGGELLELHPTLLSAEADPLLPLLLPIGF